MSPKTRLFFAIAAVFLVTHAPAARAGFSVVPSQPQQQQGQQQAQPIQPSGEDDAGVQQLLETRRKQQEAYDKLNAMNPLSEGFDPTKQPDANGPMGAAQRLLANPLVQRYLALASNPATAPAFKAVADHPNRMLLLYCEGGAFILFLVFRAWRRAKATHWARRLWASFYSFGLYVVVAWGVLPALVIGPAYVDALKMLISA